MQPKVERNAAANKLDFLEGLRALTATYIVCSHAATVAPRASLSWPFQFVLHGLIFGHYAVGIFIVVSGYCLMLPVEASLTMALRGGIRRFVYRRAKRILPPYYAALLFSIAVSLFDKRVKCIPLSIGSLVSHLFLVQNIDPKWATDFNIVLWTIATEWQIYFIFALILLPLRRAKGLGVTVGVAVILGITPYLTPLRGHLFYAGYWYIGLFAFGMSAAQLRLKTGAESKLVKNSHRLLITAFLFYGLGVICLQFYPYEPLEIVSVDFIMGFATACLIAFCASPTGSRSKITRALSSKSLTSLGLFSYSLYLTHFPILSVMDWCFKHLHQSDNLEFIFQFVVAVPLCVVAAYIFFLVFERPFLSTDRRGNVQIVPTMVAAP